MIKIKNVYFIVVLGVVIFLSCNAHAVYFTIQLNNGNEIKSDKYWDEGDSIRFYTKEGLVAIPHTLIKQIVSSDGALALDDTGAELGAVAAPEERSQELLNSRADENKKAEIVSEIKDRMAVIDSNLDSLAKNREVYSKQTEQFLQQKQKSAARVTQLKTDPYTSPKDQKDSIDFEESKLKDIDDKIKDMEAKNQNADKMIEAQQRMKTRLEGELSKINTQAANR